MKINPLHPIGVIVLIVVLVYMRRRKNAGGGRSFPLSFGKAPQTAAPAKPARPPKPEEPPEVVYAKLRRQALETSQQSLGRAGEVRDAEAFGLLMEMGMAGTVVTLACFADGDAGLYYQSGGGMKGGIAHESVRKVVKTFMEQSQGALPHMSPAADQPAPEPGRVVFYALTPGGILGTAMDREELEELGNPFAPLFHGGQEVVAEMRKVQRTR